MTGYHVCALFLLLPSHPSLLWYGCQSERPICSVNHLMKNTGSTSICSLLKNIKSRNKTEEFIIFSEYYIYILKNKDINIDFEYDVIDKLVEKIC